VKSRPLIAIAGPVGAGKSTLVNALASRLGDATAIHFDHYERITERPIEQIRDWMRNGADPNHLEIAGLAEDLEALKSGRSIVHPATRALVPAGRYIVFETQFGRQHAATGRHIDFLVWIDTPLDIALARKVRQFTLGVGTTTGEIRSFVPWLGEYLQNYASFVGALLRIQSDTVVARADLVIDGRLDPGTLVTQLLREIERAGLDDGSGR
jgi:energy-coupling factor transporter ATP-binding protein EcfA2